MTLGARFMAACLTIVTAWAVIATGLLIVYQQPTIVCRSGGSSVTGEVVSK